MTPIKENNKIFRFYDVEGNLVKEKEETSLEEAQEFVDGFIEIVSGEYIVNEDGRIKNPPLQQNKRFSFFVGNVIQIVNK